MSVWKKWWWVLIRPGMTTWRLASKVCSTGADGRAARRHQLDDPAVFHHQPAAGALRQHGQRLLDPQTHAPSPYRSIASLMPNPMKTMPAARPIALRTGRKTRVIQAVEANSASGRYQDAEIAKSVPKASAVSAG